MQLTKKGASRTKTYTKVIMQNTFSLRKTTTTSSNISFIYSNFDITKLIINYSCKSGSFGTVVMMADSQDFEHSSQYIVINKSLDKERENIVPVRPTTYIQKSVQFAISKREHCNIDTWSRQQICLSGGVSN